MTTQCGRWRMSAGYVIQIEPRSILLAYGSYKEEAWSKGGDRVP